MSDSPIHPFGARPWRGFGARTRAVYALAPGVILDRFEVAFTAAPRAYGPVPETRIAP